MTTILYHKISFFLTCLYKNDALVIPPPQNATSSHLLLSWYNSLKNQKMIWKSDKSLINIGNNIKDAATFAAWFRLRRNNSISNMTISIINIFNYRKEIKEQAQWGSLFLLHHKEFFQTSSFCSVSPTSKYNTFQQAWQLRLKICVQLTDSANPVYICNLLSN